MERQGPNIGSKLEGTSSSPPNLADFFVAHDYIVTATTTPHKVIRAREYFRGIEIQLDKKFKYSNNEASREELISKDPADISQDKVIDVSQQFAQDGKQRLIIGTDCLKLVYGEEGEEGEEIGPLGKLHGTERDVIDRLMQIIGPNHTMIGEAAVLTGIAIYSTLLNRGVRGVISFPFSFNRMTSAEVIAYKENNPEIVRSVSAGVDFAETLAPHIRSICRIVPADPAYPYVSSQFKDGCFGFPRVQLTQAFEQFPKEKGDNTWQSVNVCINR